MDNVQLLNPSYTFVELGAGRAMLSLALSQVLPNVDLVLIDRSGTRRKADVKLANARRATIDIRDLDLNNCVNNQPTVVFSKHLCGVATDLSIRAALRTKCEGIAIASCCHQRCTWEDYINPLFFTHTMTCTPFEFQLIVAMSTWFTCHLKENSLIQKEIGLNQQQRAELGKKWKQLLDIGRLEYIQQHSTLKTKYIQYCNLDDTLENHLLLAYT